MKLIVLKDYKGYFGSKHDSDPYRGGMDKSILSRYFLERNIELNFKFISEIDFHDLSLKGQIVLYTSQEDPGFYYKDYIEDIIQGLEVAGAIVIPSFRMLRANNNKVFMEILRNLLFPDDEWRLRTSYYGTYEEFLQDQRKHEFPLVIKESYGAMGKNVYLANNMKEAQIIIKNQLKIGSIREVIKEELRAFKYPGYIKDSAFRKKFVVQEFIPGLVNDWKVYVFGDKYYVFYRPIFKKRGFRASGGGYDNYYYGVNANIPDGLFEFAKEVFKTLDVPNASLDIGYSNGVFYLFEFQCIYFGTAGILKKYSGEFFENIDGKWVMNENEGDIEKVYVESIINYLDKKEIR